ncbi:MAG: class I SAM-dependent rRNA methyltransferase, partial [Proteobacteria bacterium]|nr:class I SAM-dependent rRNA methyltransferase [Pseudomonadota bacterium]
VEMTQQKELVGWGLYDSGSIAIRVLGRGPAQSMREMLAERIVRADRVRTRLLSPETDCCRILAGPGDGLPGLVLDRYDNLGVLRIYAAAWEPHLPHIVQAISRLPWLQTLYRRFGVARVDGRTGGETLVGPEAPDQLVVCEEGMRLLVRPKVGQKTGLFLDQRQHRSLVRRWAAGRNVANLFAYNGGFSVAAALGGCSRVVSVDIARDALEDARENFRLNGLDPDDHGFEVADAFRWSTKSPVDLLIVDPPSLSHGQASTRTALNSYRELHQRLGKQVSRDGLLASSSCTARVDISSWRKAIQEGLARTGDWSWHWLSHEPVDHPVTLGHSEGQYLKFALLRRR